MGLMGVRDTGGFDGEQWSGEMMGDASRHGLMGVRVYGN
jgi:hypothetical protein